MDNKPERGDHWTCFLFSIPVFDHLGDTPHGSPVQKDGVLFNQTKQYKYIGKVGGKQVVFNHPKLTQRPVVLCSL